MQIRAHIDLRTASTHMRMVHHMQYITTSMSYICHLDGLLAIDH